MNDIKILLEVYNYLFENDLIKTQKEFAEMIGETKFGWNDLKAERKKVTLSHLRIIASKYNEINWKYLFMGEGCLLDKSELEDNPLIDDYVKSLIDNNKLLSEKVISLESKLKELKNLDQS